MDDILDEKLEKLLGKWITIEYTSSHGIFDTVTKQSSTSYPMPCTATGKLEHFSDKGIFCSDNKEGEMYSGFQILKRQIKDVKETTEPK